MRILISIISFYEEEYQNKISICNFSIPMIHAI